MKDIPGYEGLYAITPEGRVWSYRRNRFLVASGGKGNYQMIGLHDAEGNYKQDYVHRLVAKTYIPNPCGYKEVNHKDEIKDHNWIDNLEWCSRKYNINYGTRTKKQSLSRQQKGKQKGKAVYCVELDKTFPSLIQAARELSVYGEGIGECCRGKQKTAYGYHWQYADTVTSKKYFNS